MKILHISSGYTIDTPTGCQKVDRQYGDTCYIVDNYDLDGNYVGASYLTDREIIHAHHNMTGKAYDFVVFDKEEDEV